MEHQSWPNPHDARRGRIVDITTRRGAERVVVLSDGAELHKIVAFPGRTAGRRRPGGGTTAAYEWREVPYVEYPWLPGQNDGEADGNMAHALCWGLGFTGLVIVGAWLSVAHGWPGVITTALGFCLLGRVVNRIANQATRGGQPRTGGAR